MTNKKGLFKRLPFFVLILSVYPSLALLSTNIGEVEAGVVIRPLSLSLLGMAILLLILRYFLKDWIWASFATSVVLVLFFSYGHIARLLIIRADPALTTALQIGLTLLFLGVLGFSLPQIAKKSFKGMNWVASINAIALVLIFFPLVQIGSTVLRGNAGDSQSVPTPLPNAPTETNQPASTQAYILMFT